MLAFDTRNKVTEWMKFEPTAYKEYYFPVEVQKKENPLCQEVQRNKKGREQGSEDLKVYAKLKFS